MAQDDTQPKLLVPLVHLFSCFPYNFLRLASLVAISTSHQWSETGLSTDLEKPLFWACLPIASASSPALPLGAIFLGWSFLLPLGSTSPASGVLCNWDCPAHSTHRDELMWELFTHIPDSLLRKMKKEKIKH